MAFQHYLGSELVIQSVAPSGDLARTLPYSSYVPMDAVVAVAGRRPCNSFALALTSSTPEICVGPDAATTWSVDPASSPAVWALKSGQCQLSVAVVGSTAAMPVAFDLEVEPAPTPPADPCDGAVCASTTDTCATGYELGVRADGCCSECIAVPDAGLCEAERVTWDAQYEANLGVAAGCALDSDCTMTVLVGGCRRYCFIGLANDRIADFMNAISESYYTGCPHCMVDNPADCAPSPRPYCEGGQCRLWSSATP